MDTKRYIVLDLDGTLHPGTAGMALLKELAHRGLCSRADAERLRAFVGSLRPENLHTRTSAATAYRLWADAIKGASAPALEEAAHDVWERRRPDVFPYVRPTIKMLHQHGFRTVLLSGSPHEIVCAAAADLGLDHARGAQFHVDRNVYSGRILGAPGIPGTKPGLLGSMLPAPLDLGSVIALGDSVADIGLFHAIGHPIAFEPDRLLSHAATRFGWPVADRNSIQALMTAVLRMYPPVS